MVIKEKNCVNKCEKLQQNSISLSAAVSLKLFNIMSHDVILIIKHRKILWSRQLVAISECKFRFCLTNIDTIKQSFTCVLL